MKKFAKLFACLIIFTLFIFAMTGCFATSQSSSNNNNGENDDNTPTEVKLESITLNADKLEVEIGDTVTLSFTPNPENPELSSDGKNYDSKYVSYYVRINGEEKKLTSNKGTATYTVESFSDMTFFAKYCNHSAHDDTAGDVVSNLVDVKIKVNAVSSAEDLKNLANSNKNFVLTSNIDLSGENWQPIEGFQGKLDGDGYTINGLKISETNKENVGLFGTLLGTVENLNLAYANVSVAGNVNNVGILAGINKGTVSAVSVSGEIDADSATNVGGIVGYNEKGIIADSESIASVEGKENVGGIVGKMLITTNDTLKNCENKGEVEGEKSVGGVCGLLTTTEEKKDITLTISNNTNKGEVEGDENVGGVFGEVLGQSKYSYPQTYYQRFELSLLSNSGKIEADSATNVGGLIGKGTYVVTLSLSKNEGNVSGKLYVGGYVGYSPDTNIKANSEESKSAISVRAYVGAFAGYAGLIEKAKNAGQILVTGPYIEEGVAYSYVGGIAGYCTGIIECENTADIVVTDAGKYVGGIAGYVLATQNDVVNENRNSGKISAKDNVGGIAGMLTTNAAAKDITYSVSENENSGQINGNDNVGGVFGEVLGQSKYSYPQTYYQKFELSLISNTGTIYAENGNNVGGLVGRGEYLATIVSSENEADVFGDMYVGGYVGYSEGTNIKAGGAENRNIISGKAYVGAFAGKAGIIEKASNSGQILPTGSYIEDGVAYSYVGGIAGYCTGAIECTNYSDITVLSAGKYVGGIAGYIKISDTDRIKKNENRGNIDGKDTVGGIAGKVEVVKKEVTKTYSVSENTNKGYVNGTEKVGGIFGEALGYAQRVGMSTYTQTIEITGCANKGELDANGGTYVGGIVGYYEYMDKSDAVMNTNTTDYGNKLGH